MQITSNGLKQSFKLILLIPGIIAFIVYWLTMATTLQVADAGEQITAAHFLGISHPTGTPLYLFLMKVWELAFPFGTVVWRMNLLNAILGAITVIIFAGLIFRICHFYRISSGRSLFLALSMSLTLAYSKTYWYESLAASSYLLHYLFVVLWLSVLVKMILEEDYNILSRLYLFTGFALANHVLSLVLLFLTLWYSVSLFLRKNISFGKLCLLQTYLVPGLLLYLYIPFRAATDPLVNWGDPDSFGRFIHYISRKDYYGTVYVSTLSDFFDVFIFHLKSFCWEMSLVLPILLVGSMLLHAVYWFIKRKKKVPDQNHIAVSDNSDGKPNRKLRSYYQIIILGIMLMILNMFFLSLHGSHLDIFLLKRYMEPGYIGLFLSSAVFLVLTQRFFANRYFFIVTLCIALMPMICLVSHFELNDRSQNTLLKCFVDQVSLHLPEGATYYAIGDNYLFPVMYYHLVEGCRPDLKLFNPRIGLGKKAVIPSLIKAGTLYSSHYIKTKEPVKSIPMGLVFKVTDRMEPATKVMAWREFNDNEIRQAQAPLEKILIVDYYYRRSVYHEERHEQEQRLFCTKKMESAAQGYDQTLMLTGRAYARMEMVPKATKYFKAALAINPKNRVARFYLKKYLDKPL
jgi:tetratricopeptide (TPR) repeat protein